jgi:hypothetical protein
VSGEPLTSFDQNEWWDVCRKLRPDLDRETFDEMWAKFAKMKRRKQLQ